jgi:serine/threonine protein kinase/tetratricopeptide (TPR) repeat protein
MERGEGEVSSMTIDRTSDATRLPPPTPAPEMIGPYRVLGVLGEGGMGTVYEAAETGPVRRRVALKIVRAGLNSREVLARFALERQALALMNHEGIAKVYHAGETERGEPYFAMELVHGLPITDYCDSQRLTPRQRLELFSTVCLAVQHAHQKGVIHRDLKPSNIIVTEQDGVARAKVIDFGIAKALSAPLTDFTLVSRLGEPLGTALYMSPEQAESSGLDVDTRTDIYSLGVILFELLVGEPPMAPRGEAIHVFMARLASRRTDPPTPSSRLTTLGTGCEAVAYARHTDPDSLRRQLRGDIDWIVVKALDPDRTRRYDSAAALSADIGRHLANEPVTARAPSRSYRLRKFVLRHPVAVPLAIGAVLAIATSASFAVAGLVRARRAERVAQQEAAAARSVTEFLIGLFAPDGMSAGNADQLTARQLLDRGAARASRELASQPLLRGRILQSVGKAYATLGLYDEARTQLDEALAARTRAQGAMSLPVAETELELASVTASHGDLTAAEGHYARALAIREALLGREHPLVARVAYGIGALRSDQGRLDEAEAQYRRALGIDEHSAADSTGMASDLMGLSVVYWQRKQYAQAESLMKRSIAIQEQHLGPDHGDVAASLNNLGALYWSMERYSDALPLYERVRTTFERTLDPAHPELAAVYSNLAETYWKVGRFAEAESLFRRSLAMKEKRLAPGNPRLAITLHSLAGLLRDEGKLPDAEVAYRRALDIRLRAFGPTNSDVRETGTALAALLRTRGRTREADSLTTLYASRR